MIPTGLLALDLETRDDGISSGKGAGWAFGAGRIVGASVACGPQAHYYSVERYGIGRLRAYLHELLTSGNPIVFHNSPYDLGWLGTLGLPYPEKIHDTMCMAVMLDENRLSYSLDSVCAWQGVPGKDQQLLKEAAVAFGIADVKSGLWRLPEQYVGPYAEQDARATLALAEKMLPILQADGVMEAYTLEMDIIPLIVEMRKRGIRIDVKKAEQEAKRLREKRDEQIAELSRKTNTRLGITDMLSPTSLERLFDAEGIPYGRTPKSNRGQFESEWLQNHSHWLPQGVAAARLLEQASSKFLTGFVTDFSSLGRIHAEIHSYRSDDGGTRSHRFSYSNPPLQQMPSRVEWIKKAIRGVFLPEDGEYWYAADYSQQEPRFTVHYAAEINVFGSEEAVNYYTNDPNADYHQMVADMAGIVRKVAKIINLGLAYGMGAALLAESLGVTREEADKLLQMYHHKVPFIKLLTERCSSLAQSRGYIKLIDGAKCRFDMWEPATYGRKDWGALPHDKALARWPGERLRRAFTHKAMNRLIQGSSARQTKMAMRECWRRQYIPLLQMHDDLNFSLSNEKDGLEIAEIMRNVVKLRVPMKVDGEWGRDWGDATHTWEELKIGP